MDDPGCDVVVVGSANLDVVLGVDALARPGETVLATTRAHGPGGKGLNQAVAAARSGARTALVAAVGDDGPGRSLRAQLQDAGVLTDALRVAPDATGTAYVVVDRHGENAIVVHPGANSSLQALAGSEREVVGAARVVLCQLEVAVSAVADALRSARGLRVLNAAPARELPAEVLDLVDVLVVNEGEALALAPGAATTEEAVEALGASVAEVVVTLGPRGAVVVADGVRTRVPGVPARHVRDTTGAGDVLCGALAAARARGEAPGQAVRAACAAASLSVEREGAARSAPTLSEVQARLAELEQQA